MLRVRRRAAVIEIQICVADQFACVRGLNWSTRSTLTVEIRLGENPGFRVSIRIGCLDRIVSIRSILSEQISVA